MHLGGSHKEKSRGDNAIISVIKQLSQGFAGAIQYALQGVDLAQVYL